MSRKLMFPRTPVGLIVLIGLLLASVLAERAKAAPAARVAIIMLVRSPAACGKPGGGCQPAKYPVTSAHDDADMPQMPAPCSAT
jgi:hypothetical protein